MATELSKGNLFDPVLVKDLISKVKGKSSLAVLSAQTPIPFNGRKEFTFTMDSEIDVVAENGKKTHGGESQAFLQQPVHPEHLYCRRSQNHAAA